MMESSVAELGRQRRCRGWRGRFTASRFNSLGGDGEEVEAKSLVLFDLEGGELSRRRRAQPLRSGVELGERKMGSEEAEPEWGLGSSTWWGSFSLK